MSACYKLEIIRTTDGYTLQVNIGNTDLVGTRKKNYLKMGPFMVTFL